MQKIALTQHMDRTGLVKPTPGNQRNPCPDASEGPEGPSVLSLNQHKSLTWMVFLLQIMLTIFHAQHVHHRCV
jgi:hypothetical protein